MNHIIKRSLLTLFAAGIIAGSWSSAASAHVVVRPAEVETGSFQTFTVSVPNENDSIANNKVRVVLPEGLKHVSPTVKPGWTIETVKQGEGEDATTSEIIWSGGSIPGGQRDDFSFSAQTPAEPTSLAWRAYQQFEDGSVTSWDNPPSDGGGHGEGANPYSITDVVDSLSTTPAANEQAASNNAANFALVASVLALIVAVYGLTSAKPAKKSRK